MDAEPKRTKKHYDGALDSWYKAGSIEWLSFVLPIIIATHYSSEYIQSPIKGLVSRFHIMSIGFTRTIIYILLVVNSHSNVLEYIFLTRGRETVV